MWLMYVHVWIFIYRYMCIVVYYTTHSSHVKLVFDFDLDPADSCTWWAQPHMSHWLVTMRWDRAASMLWSDSCMHKFTWIFPTHTNDTLQYHMYYFTFHYLGLTIIYADLNLICYGDTLWIPTGACLHTIHVWYYLMHVYFCMVMQKPEPFRSLAYM